MTFPRPVGCDCMKLRDSISNSSSFSLNSYPPWTSPVPVFLFVDPRPFLSAPLESLVPGRHVRKMFKGITPSRLIHRRLFTPSLPSTTTRGLERAYESPLSIRFSSSSKESPHVRRFHVPSRCRPDPRLALCSSNTTNIPNTTSAAALARCSSQPSPRNPILGLHGPLGASRWLLQRRAYSKGRPSHDLDGKQSKTQPAETTRDDARPAGASSQDTKRDSHHGNTGPSEAESESIAASMSKYLPKIPHRPTREELLAAATGFWSRMKVRFKWMSIRSMRPWNADEWGAFVSWFMLGHLVWILVGTTTFFSLVIFSINTVFAQGMARFFPLATCHILTGL